LAKIFTLFVLLTFTAYTIIAINYTIVKLQEGSRLNQRLQMAAEYIACIYDQRIGLVSKSDDWVVMYQIIQSCYRTFWVYSDNLWASKALEPYNYFIARNISKTISPYIGFLVNQIFSR